MRCRGTVGVFFGRFSVERAPSRHTCAIVLEWRNDILNKLGLCLALGLVHLARKLADQHPGTARMRVIACDAGRFRKGKQ